MTWPCGALESSSERIYSTRVLHKTKNIPDKNDYQRKWDKFIVLRNTYTPHNIRKFHLFFTSLHRRRLGGPSCGWPLFLFAVQRSILFQVDIRNARYCLVVCVLIFLGHFLSACHHPQSLNSNEMSIHRIVA